MTSGHSTACIRAKWSTRFLRSWEFVVVVAATGVYFSLLSYLHAREREKQAELERYLENVVYTSQSIAAVDVGQCRNSSGLPLRETERIIWKDPYAAPPPPRSGNHLAYITIKEQPVFIDDDLGGRFEKTVLSPSVEVGIDLLPESRVVQGKKVTGRLWASYRSLDLTSEYGISPYVIFGLFGSDFRVGGAIHTQPHPFDLAPISRVNLKPCQILTRLPNKTRDASRTFFSLPVDIPNNGDIEDFMGINYRNVKRVWSMYQSPEGEKWLIWCRANPAEKESVNIQQCTIDSIAVEEEGDAYKIWQRKSPLESFTRKIGEHHTVANLTFKVANIVFSPQYPRMAWMHISDPKLDLSPLPK